MSAILDFKDLIAWQKAMDLVTAIYRTTKGFPESERFGLTSQLRRAAVSVPSNIAPGDAADALALAICGAQLAPERE